MCDKELIIDILHKIDDAITAIEQRTEDIHSANDFLTSWIGTVILDSICMKLTAMGESIKNLDKITNKELLVNYPEIPWKGIMGTRDIIAHHYFDIDAFEIFRICKNDLAPLQQTIRKIIVDVENSSDNIQQKTI